jgi:PAS domain-containing protein
MASGTLFLLFSAGFLWAVLSFGRLFRAHTRMLRVPRPTQAEPADLPLNVSKPQRLAHVFGNSFTDTAADIVFVKNGEHRYQWINPAGVRFFGRNLDQIIGSTDSDLFSRDTAERHIRDDDRVMTTGQAQTRVADEEVGGTSHRFLVHKMPWRSPDGQVLGVIGLATELGAATSN